MVPGWAYSFIAAVEPGPTSWTQILDAQRLGPDDDAAEITAVQVRCTVERLVTAGQHAPGDRPIAIVVDAGYDVPRLPWEAPAKPGRLTAARVRRAFPDLHATLPRLTDVPKPSKPGSGRPPGRRNNRKAPIRDPGKKAKRDKTLAQREQRLTSAQA